MKKKVMMFGGGAKKRYFVDDKSAEIWVCNGQHTGQLSWLPRVDRAFNLHRHALLVQYGYDTTNESIWSMMHPEIPFITVDKWPDKFARMGNNQLLPLAKMKKQPRGLYHCGTFDWFVAYAVLEGFKQIELHGINLRLEATEPGSAQACLEYWCGYAEGKGVRVTTAKDATLFYYSHTTLTDRTYGLDDAPIYVDDRKHGIAYDYRP